MGFKGEWADHLFQNRVMDLEQVLFSQLDQEWTRSFFANTITSLGKSTQNPQKEMRHRVIEILESVLNQEERTQPVLHEKLLEAVREQMVQNFKEHRPIEAYFESGKKVVEEQNFSYSYFRSLFKNRFGQSPGQFLDQLRLSEAKKLLHLGQKPIREISDELGFENPYYFSRFFKKHQGLSPKHFC